MLCAARAHSCVTHATGQQHLPDVKRSPQAIGDPPVGFSGRSKRKQRRYHPRASSAITTAALAAATLSLAAAALSLAPAALPTAAHVTAARAANVTAARAAAAQSPSALAAPALAAIRVGAAAMRTRYSLAALTRGGMPLTSAGEAGRESARVACACSI